MAPLQAAISDRRSELIARNVRLLGRFEDIPSWTVFDVDYGYSRDFGGTVAGLEIGALNVLDAAPPAVEGALGYEVGIHDPRGRSPSQATGRIPDPYPELRIPPAATGKIVGLPVLGGLHHDYRRAA